MHKVVCVTPLRFCSPQFIVIMGWDAKDCRLEKAIRWVVGWGGVFSLPIYFTSKVIVRLKKIK